ncbi:sugar transferase [Ruminococcus sp. 5_1_39BFAA]|uniref:sugar transferase n=1 Tax=Ruminococcus sp. 5_1_39BFAA TaxID=457412 RepID=UPI003569C6F5
MNDKQKKSIVKIIYRILALILAFVTSAELWFLNVGPYWRKTFNGSRTLFMVGVIYCITYWFFVKLYNAQKIGHYRLPELVFSQMLAFAIADFCLYGAAFVWFHDISRMKLLSFFVAFIIQMAVITFVIFVCNKLYARYSEKVNIVIIYGDEDYKFLIRKMEIKNYHYRIRECLDQHTDISRLCAAIEQCDDVYLCNVDAAIRNQVVLYCDSIQKDIHISVGVEELLTMGYDVSHAFDTPYIRNKKAPVEWYYPFVKRFFDIVCSLAGLVILSPLLLIVSIAIKACDGGPVLFKQERLTQNGKTFYIYKFRSMILNAEEHGARLASQHDDRITPVGRVIRALRIDELPQLFNVLKGEMSIVGPRPERPEIAEVYKKDVPEFSLRLKVKAGLTGYAQVFGKYNTTPEDKLKLDLLYINQRSLLFDLRIIFYTMKIIFIPESTEGIEDGKETAAK